MVRACRILIVEDDAVGRDALRAVLELVGHTVMEAADGWTALEMAETQPDIVVLDIDLPRLDGFAVAEALTSPPGPHPFIIGLSGYYAHKDDLARARAGGFDAYLMKPCDLNELLDLVERISTQPQECAAKGPTEKT